MAWVGANPLRWESGGTLLDLVSIVMVLTIMVTAVAASISSTLPCRRAAPSARLQMRAVVTAVVALLVFIPVGGLSTALTGSDRPASVLSDVGLVLPPAGVGVAVLRYRLYDVDRVITRTVAWAVVTAVLAGVYAALVVAAATLAAAALLRPVRVRVPRAVDRRFGRARHDAAQEVEAFGARLRDEWDVPA